MCHEILEITAFLFTICDEILTAFLFIICHEILEMTAILWLLSSMAGVQWYPSVLAGGGLSVEKAMTMYSDLP